jgi:hypothetical protein
MILNAFFGRRWHHAEASDEVPMLIAELMATLKHEDTSNWWLSPGDEAWLCFLNRRLEGMNFLGESGRFLRVSLNTPTGYGAMIWVDRENGNVWVSDSPSPPAYDPRVVADPHYPLFHDPDSALPLEQFKTALEEFCYAGTGERPASVRWVRGDMSGRRADREYPEDPGTGDIADPWG